MWITSPILISPTDQAFIAENTSDKDTTPQGGVFPCITHVSPASVVVVVLVVLVVVSGAAVVVVALVKVVVVVAGIVVEVVPVGRVVVVWVVDVVVVVVVVPLAAVTLLESNVTAVCANALPFNVAPVFITIAV